MEVIEMNQEVADKPELINEDAHERGWLIKIKITNQSEFEGLLSAEEYEELISQDQH
jgi:glycine cleavage system H protein